MQFATTHRLATAEEIKALQALPGAPHVAYGCTACGLGHWTAKNLTLSDEGTFIAIRNIFYDGDAPECNCSPAALRCIVPL